jgi:AbiJ-like protein
MTDKSTGLALLSIRKHIVEHFDSGDWTSLGLLTGSVDIVRNHNRLLRSLSFGDPDYSSCVVEVLHGMVERDPDNLATIQSYVRDSEGTVQNATDGKDKDSGFASPKVFEMPAGGIQGDLVAVMMPFGPSFDPVIEAIRGACSAEGLQCKRADDVWEHETLIQDIFNLIYRSPVVVCDFTGRNPNVFYEAGIAHALGRTVIPLTQSKDDVPFDLQRFRYIHYLNNTEGLKTLRSSLTTRLRTA